MQRCVGFTFNIVKTYSTKVDIKKPGHVIDIFSTGHFYLQHIITILAKSNDFISLLDIPRDVIICFVFQKHIHCSS